MLHNSSCVCATLHGIKDTNNAGAAEQRTKCDHSNTIQVDGVRQRGITEGEWWGHADAESLQQLFCLEWASVTAICMVDSHGIHIWRVKKGYFSISVSCSLGETFSLARTLTSNVLYTIPSRYKTRETDDLDWKMCNTYYMHTNTLTQYIVLNFIMLCSEKFRIFVFFYLIPVVVSLFGLIFHSHSRV